jgi:hypothetical protein
VSITAKMAILPRRPAHGNVLEIPTPPLQQAALFVIFFFTGLAAFVYGLRVYTRLRTRQWGLDDYLVSAAMLFSLMMIGPFYMCKPARLPQLRGHMIVT